MNGIVVLYSGGLDSTSLLYWALGQKCRVVALSFEYGQRHFAELAAASRICGSLRVEHEVMSVHALAHIGGSGLIGGWSSKSGPLPDLTAEQAIVPGRNGVFIWLAACYAVSLKFDTVAIGCNADDGRDFKDCRPQFLTGIRLALHYAGLDVAVEAPFAGMAKAGVVRFGREAGMTPEIEASTVSCYLGARGDGCGKCHACKVRATAVGKC